MIDVKNKGKSSAYVYDISLDGTVVNALGLNVCSNTDGFNFKLPSKDKFRYTDAHPYISSGLSRETEEGKAYTGFRADVAEFNDLYMKDFHYSDAAVNKMGLGIDEVVDATINFSRKNYSDYFPDEPFPDDVKMVGNTIKSKKMPEYIAKFLSKGIRLLLQNKGKEFLDEYYAYVDKIYNYKIPLRDIASKGKIKKSLKEYKKDVQEITKAGRHKSRQAWYELAIQNNLSVSNGDTIYYVNTGEKKSDSDVKKITHCYIYNEDGEKVDITKEIDKEWKKYQDANKKNIDYYPPGSNWHPIPSSESLLTKEKFVKKIYPAMFKEEEILMNCVLVPREIIDREEDTYCSDVSEDMDYNVIKYIDQFNKRITPLLVCFSKEIRSKILINDPKDKPYFTKRQCILSSGEPNKESDQDTYEQLMTMEDKEIKFWKTYNLVPPFIEECGMGKWEDILMDYDKRMKEEEDSGIAYEKNLFKDTLSSLKENEIEEMEEGEIPEVILKIADIDPISSNFLSKKFKTPIGSLDDIGDVIEQYHRMKENSDN